MSLKKEETLGLMGGALQKPGGKQLLKQAPITPRTGVSAFSGTQ
jgi:hypothetical protein